MISDRDALIRACLASPLDDAPRMILSDFLEEANWGDPLLRSALRGEGDWYVSAWGEVAYRFHLAKRLESMYFKGTLVIDYGYEWQGKADIVLGKIDHGIRCQHCGKTNGLNFRQARWQCAIDCTKPRTTGTFSSMSMGAMVTFMSVGGAIPPYWLSDQLGLPSPEE
jgi:uncharacterized protein (TIGR02996 family)